MSNETLPLPQERGNEVRAAYERGHREGYAKGWSDAATSAVKREANRLASTTLTEEDLRTYDYAVPVVAGGQGRSAEDVIQSGNVVAYAVVGVIGLAFGALVYGLAHALGFVS